MKLSMWMIANRLPEELEKTCKISENDRPVLRSARLVYATDCVYVHVDGDDVVYNGNNVACGLTLYYTDGSTNTTTVITGGSRGF